MWNIVRRMEKHKSVLREQTQQINLKSVLPKQNTFKSVLNWQNTFKSVFNLFGLFVEHTFGEKLFQRYIQKSFLVIGDFKKIWNHAKILFLVRPQYCPPFFSQSSGRHWIGVGERWGVYWVRTKKWFGTIPYFLEIADVWEAHLIFEKISVLPKVYWTNMPNRWIWEPSWIRSLFLAWFLWHS